MTHAGGDRTVGRPLESTAIEERPPKAPDLPDQELCDWIESDAEALVARGEAPGLDRYLEAIEGLESRPVALDAALSVVLRYSMRSGLSREEVVSTLASNYPRLESAILACDLLDEALAEPDAPPQEALPRELGPRQPDGRGRYQLLELLDSGVQGRVYRAVDRTLSDEGRPAVVAVKVARAGGATKRAEALREAVRAKRVDHDNVVRVLDAGDGGDGQVYVVFDYVDGQTLWDWRERRSAPLGHREAARIVRDLARGLAASHRAGLYHLDIHPRNVLMRAGDRPTLVDFGCGRSILESGEPFWRGRGALGFIAPESYREEPWIPPHLSDVYATGAILYWLLTGRFANGESEEEVERNLAGEGRRQAPPALAGVAGRVDPDLAAVVSRALEPDPARRTPSADAIVQDLDRLLSHEPLPWRGQSAPRRFALWVRRSPARAAGLGLGLVGAVAGAALATGATINAQHVQEREALQRDLVEQRALAQVQEAELEAARADSERINQAQHVFATLNRFVSGIDPRSARDEWLVPITFLEQMTADGGYQMSEFAAAAREKRLEVARRNLQRYQADPGVSQVELLLLTAATGAWELEAEDFADAAEHLADAERLAEGLVDAGDPYPRRLRQLRLVAEALVPGGPEANAARERLQRADRSALPRWARRLADRALSEGPNTGD